MTSEPQPIAVRCLRGAETDAMSFPEIVATLIGAGFEGYLTDLRAGETRYYGPDDGMVALAHEGARHAVAAAFDESAIRAAIRDAQAQAPGYRYLGFLDTIAAAGCAGYLVSFPGRRVLYFGRSGDVHVEHFPSAD
jgi:uncharacterized protein YbcV (DUF1398 family)